MMTPVNQTVADSALLSELKILARTPNLLAACNYGGTLCAAEGIFTETLPLGSAAVALHALAALPNTHASVISGRPGSSPLRIGP